ncbi:hypothetical protein KU6B_57230 (plasmid) [Mameliella alba]|uniref:SEL1-like repeat protein n=1 Tax=Mameliella alba TaxID=561184 RepID=UPI0013E48E53|nr:SEL1-like repeat protein [Mameliella alba]BBU59458.1 hypothetical protein KU6B_57230 [Mameliella alba]
MSYSRLIQAVFFAGSLSLFASPVSALNECDFSFDVDQESSALPAIRRRAEALRGYWRPIREAPDDVQQVARFIGRLDVCLVTPDGKPRTIDVGGSSRTLESPYVTTCTAALLPGNRLLANRHCFYEETLVKAGFRHVQEARINFGYIDADFTDEVLTFHVSSREVAQDEATDALVMQILGGDANERLGGHIPMVMETRATPRRALTMIHHPRRQPQRFSSGTCQIHPDQSDLPESSSLLRHVCETDGGSSGALLLDARTLAVVGLHNRAGLRPDGSGFNGGHKIAAVEAALNLGFEERKPAAAKAPDSSEVDAALALASAMAAKDKIDREAELNLVLQDFPDTRAANLARSLLEADRKKDAVKKAPPDRVVIGNFVDADAEKKDTQGPVVVEIIEDSVDVPETECDRLAADPMDRQKIDSVAGFYDMYRIDVSRAIPACELAVQRHPAEPRLNFQLARALDADDRYEDAMPYYQRAQAAGHVGSMTMIGWLYQNGQGVPKDYAEAERWFRKAREAGDVKAIEALAYRYRKGEGIGKDLEAAARLYRQAAEQGVLSSIYRMGWYHYEGAGGVEKDYAKAARWFRQAVEIGNHAASLWYLASMYSNGQGVAQDHSESAAYTFRAVLAGHSRALEQAKMPNTVELFRRELQRFLKKHGAYDGAIDGVIGPATIAALDAVFDTMSCDPDGGRPC